MRKRFSIKKDRMKSSFMFAIYSASADDNVKSIIEFIYTRVYKVV